MDRNKKRRGRNQEKRLGVGTRGEGYGTQDKRVGK